MRSQNASRCCPKYDIRDWAPDNSKMGKGISLTHDELAILKGILNDLEI